MADSKLEITVPEKLIETLVMAEVVNKIGGDGKVVEEVIRSILSEKVRAGYRDEAPLILEKFREAVKAEAQAIVKAIIAERSADIRKELERQISTKTFARNAAEAMVGAIGNSSWRIDVVLKPASE